MMNKRIPDWLNSALWSAPSPHNDGATTEPPSPVARPPAERPQVSSAADAHYAKPENRDPLSRGVSENYASACCSDEEDGRTPEKSTDSSAVPPAAKDVSRQNQFLNELSKKVVNMGEVRGLTLQGIPDGAGIRATVWKLLLGYLPADRSLWPPELAKKRSQYKQFKEELLMNPSEITRRLEESSLENHRLDTGSPHLLSRSEISHGEHPLSLGKTSIWNQFFQETEVVEQIDRDVMRTHPDIHFFSGDSTFAKSNQEALRNILIIFAKLNPGIRYVQGMNEILAPLFYIFKSDPNEENAPEIIEGGDEEENLEKIEAVYHPVLCTQANREYYNLASAEADTFFCFVELLSGFRDNFVQQLDNSVVGIRATITRLSQLLKDHDEELWRHLELTTKVNPQFYAFRWITLLLSQEFSFADSLLIWDTLLSDPDGPQETLLRVCCAMLIIVRKRLLAGDFTSNLKLLQNYPPTNISHLLYVANKLRVV